MKIELRPGWLLTRLTLVNAPMTSSTSCSACRSMSAVEKAVMLCPTSCRFSSRRVAVTMMVSSFPESFWSCWPRERDGYSVARTAAVSVLEL